MSAPVAIANAVADALGPGRRRAPADPARVWELLQRARAREAHEAAPFEYVAARSLDEALAALAEGGEDAKPIAGGQSLVPALNMRLVRPSLLVDLNLPVSTRRHENGSVRIGATVRQAALERDPRTAERLPLVAQALPHVGHVVTRNRGTVGGSIAHARRRRRAAARVSSRSVARSSPRPDGTSRDPGRRVLRHALPDDAGSRESSSSRPSGRPRSRDRASPSRSSRCAPATTRSAWSRSAGRRSRSAPSQTGRPSSTRSARWSRWKRRATSSRREAGRACGAPRRSAGDDPRLARVSQAPHGRPRRASAEAGVDVELTVNGRRGARGRRAAATALRLPPPPARADRAPTSAASTASAARARSARRHGCPLVPACSRCRRTACRSRRSRLSRERAR